MKKLIVVAFMTMFASAGAAASGTGGPDEPSTLSETADWCEEAHIECAAGCMDMSGSGKGACLRMCLHQYDECIGN